MCVSILQWVPGFRRWGRLICPDPPYNPFATYLRAPGPVYHLSRLRLILLDSEAQLPRVHARGRCTPRNPRKTRSDKSARFPRLQRHCGIGASPTAMASTGNAFPVSANPICPPEIGGAETRRTRPPCPWVDFSGVGTPDVSSEPPRLGDLYCRI